jgi:hypothetical protein
MLPKWIYYAVANFGVVTTTLLMPLLYPECPAAIWALVLIVGLIAANLTLWYSLRHRARVALADQTVANHEPKMKPIQFVLIGLGLLLLAITMFASFDQPGRIGNVLCAVFSIVLGIVLGLKKKQSSGTKTGGQTSRLPLCPPLKQFRR